LFCLEPVAKQKAEIKCLFHFKMGLFVLERKVGRYAIFPPQILDSQNLINTSLKHPLHTQPLAINFPSEIAF